MSRDLLPETSTLGSIETPDQIVNQVTGDALGYMPQEPQPTIAQQLKAAAPGYTPGVSPETNQSFIQGLMDQSQGYGKGVDGWRKAVIEAAKSALGTPYVWGGNNLSSGVDCSGLVQQAFGRAGINLPRVSYAQANFGQRVSLKNLRPGDLVAWDNSSRNNGADHIAIYLGNGQIIECPRPGLSVRIRSLGSNEGAWGVSLASAIHK